MPAWRMQFHCLSFILCKCIQRVYSLLCSVCVNSNDKLRFRGIYHVLGIFTMLLFFNLFNSANAVLRWVTIELRSSNTDVKCSCGNWLIARNRDEKVKTLSDDYRCHQLCITHIYIFYISTQRNALSLFDVMIQPRDPPLIRFEE